MTKLTFYDRVDAIRFRYVNWRGEVSQRRALPISTRFGVSEWHLDPQWLMLATDLDKNEDREFAMRDMTLVEPDL